MLRVTKVVYIQGEWSLTMILSLICRDGMQRSRATFSFGEAEVGDFHRFKHVILLAGLMLPSLLSNDAPGLPPTPQAERLFLGVAALIRLPVLLTSKMQILRGWVLFSHVA